MLASLGRPSLHFMALLTAGLSLTAPRSAQAQFQKQYKIIDLADDVFAIVWEDLFAYPVEGNHLVVIGEDGVVVVDANRTPSLTDTVIAIIRQRTSKPVRHVINTHWHADHVQGNSVYLREFPDVQILGHPETVAGIDTVLVPWVAEVRSEVVRLGSELEADTTEEGTPLTEEQRQRLKAQLARYERESKLYDAVRLAHPTLLVTDSVVITSGNRKIVVIYPGHANTPGDLMVYLPSEGIIAVRLRPDLPDTAGKTQTPWLRIGRTAFRMRRHHRRRMLEREHHPSVTRIPLDTLASRGGTSESASRLGPVEHHPKPRVVVHPPQSEPIVHRQGKGAFVLCRPLFGSLR